MLFGSITARNTVLAGDYVGCRVFRMSATCAYISGTMKKLDDVRFSPEEVDRYELLTEDMIRSGNSLLLTGSLDPGCLTSLRLNATPHNQAKGIYTLAVKFNDGKRALIEVDEKIYTAIVRRMSAQ